MLCYLRSREITALGLCAPPRFVLFLQRPPFPPLCAPPGKSREASKELILQRFHYYREILRDGERAPRLTSSTIFVGALRAIFHPRPSYRSLMSATLNREAAATGKRQQLSRKSKPVPRTATRARPRRRKMQLNPSLLSNSYSAFFIWRVTARSLERESYTALPATLALSLIKKYNTAKQKGRYNRSSRVPPHHACNKNREGNKSINGQVYLSAQ